MNEQTQTESWIITRLRSALEAYGRHYEWCAVHEGEECVCGLEDHLSTTTQFAVKAHVEQERDDFRVAASGHAQARRRLEKQLADLEEITYAVYAEACTEGRTSPALERLGAWAADYWREELDDMESAPAPPVQP